MTEDTEQRELQPQPAQEQESVTPGQPVADGQPAAPVSQDEEGDHIDARHLHELLAALQVDGKMFRRQIPLILLLFAIAVFYVTNGYQAQQEILKEEELSDSLKDCRYRCLTREGELTRRTRQSQLERELRGRGDSTLVASPEPPFLLTDE